MIRFAIAAGGLALAAAAPPVAAQEMHHPMMIEGTLLDIVAEGTSTRVPDLAMIQAGVVTQAATAADAMRQNSAQMARVLAALRKAGIVERDIQTSSVGLSPQYRYQDNMPPVITGYQASNQVTVRFRDIAKSGAILDVLVAQGANNISGPNLMVEKADAALDEARVDAIARARARASLYARAAGLSVSRIVSISESGASSPPPPRPMMMRMESAAADKTEIVPGEREMTVSVSVRFLLK